MMNKIIYILIYVHQYILFYKKYSFFYLFIIQKQEYIITCFLNKDTTLLMYILVMIYDMLSNSYNFISLLL